MAQYTIYGEGRPRACAPRTGATAEQGPSQWNAALINEAEALLLRASAMGAIGLESDPAVRAFLQRRRQSRPDVKP